MKINRIFIFLILMMLITGCTADELSDEISGDIVNVGDEVSANQMETSSHGKEDIMNAGDESGENQTENPSDNQAEEKEIVCDNPYFFSQDVSSLTADITFCGDECFTTIRGDLELHWLKQYENGCIAKLLLLPSDDIPEYSYLFDGAVREDYEYCDIYFYVTSDEIYRMNCYVVQDGEYVYAYDDEDLFLTLLDSEEKIIENAELVCCPEGIESEYTGDNIGDPFMLGEIGTHYEIVVSENQITYCRQEYPAGHMEFYNTFVWENGRGLVEHKRGYRAGALILYIENITAE